MISILTPILADFHFVRNFSRSSSLPTFSMYGSRSAINWLCNEAPTHEVCLFRTTCAIRKSINKLQTKLSDAGWACRFEMICKISSPVLLLQEKAVEIFYRNNLFILLIVTEIINLIAFFFNKTVDSLCTLRDHEKFVQKTHWVVVCLKHRVAFPFFFKPVQW